MFRTACGRTVLATGLIIGFLAGPAAAANKPAAPDTATTLANLQAAYNGESNARERYLAFAAQADKEGYRKVAQLFRAAARGEQVHAAFLAKNITDLMGTPAADIQVPEVKSTRENLAAAVSGEDYEIQSMYPQFLAQAQSAGLKMAAIAFGSAMKVEGKHKVVFGEALANLGKWKKASEGFSVCLVCGNLETTKGFTQCAVCGAPKSEFELVK